MARRIKKRESPARPASVVLVLLCALLSAQSTTDRRRWVFTMEQTIVQSPAVGSDGTIYIGTGVNWTGPASDGLYAIRPDGSLRFVLLCALLSARSTTDRRRRDLSMERTIVQSPAVGSDGTVDIGTGVNWTGPASDGLYAIRPDGSLRWKRNLGRAVHSSVALDREDNLYFLAGNADNPDRMDAAVLSYDSSGNPRWTSEAIGWMVPVPFTGFTPAIASDGSVYACGRYSLFALNKDGTRKWRFDFPLRDTHYVLRRNHYDGKPL